MDEHGGHTFIFTILIYLHILHKTLTDFEFIRLQNLSIFGLFMKCGYTDVYIHLEWIDFLSFQIYDWVTHFPFLYCNG